MLICKENEQATDFDMTEYNNKAVPTTRTGQCLNTCVLEHLGIVSINKCSNLCFCVIHNSTLLNL